MTLTILSIEIIMLIILNIFLYSAAVLQVAQHILIIASQSARATISTLNINKYFKFSLDTAIIFAPYY